MDDTSEDTVVMLSDTEAQGRFKECFLEVYSRHPGEK